MSLLSQEADHRNTITTIMTVLPLSAFLSVMISMTHALYDLHSSGRASMKLGGTLLMSLNSNLLIASTVNSLWTDDGPTR
jgi:hypothetical protein